MNSKNKTQTVGANEQALVLINVLWCSDKHKAKPDVFI